MGRWSLEELADSTDPAPQLAANVKPIFAACAQACTDTHTHTHKMTTCKQHLSFSLCLPYIYSVSLCVPASLFISVNTHTPGNGLLSRGTTSMEVPVVKEQRKTTNDNINDGQGNNLNSLTTVFKS